MAPKEKIDLLTADFQCDMMVHTRYLEFHVTGTNSPENVCAYLQRVHELSLQHNKRRVLIEEHLEGPGIGKGDIFDVIAEAWLSFDPPLARIAYIDKADDRLPDALQFAETMAQNRGIPARFFSDREAAIRWLTA